MFRGTFQHSIDPKGRTSLPAKFRERLQAQGADLLVLTQGPDRALWGYAPAAWDELMKRLQGKSPFDPTTRAFKAAFVSPAQDVPFDKLGRVLVPSMLRQHAELLQEVVWAGSVDHLELWSLERWTAQAEKAKAVLESDPFAAGAL